MDDVFPRPSSWPKVEGLLFTAQRPSTPPLAAYGLPYKPSMWSSASSPVLRSTCPILHVSASLTKPACRKRCCCQLSALLVHSAQSSLRRRISKFGEARTFRLLFHLWEDPDHLAEYQWFLPAVIGSFHSRPAKFFTGFAMLIATLGNQIGQSLLYFATFLVRDTEYSHPSWWTLFLFKKESLIIFTASPVVIAGSFPFGNDLSGVFNFK